MKAKRSKIPLRRSVYPLDYIPIDIDKPAHVAQYNKWTEFIWAELTCLTKGESFVIEAIKRINNENITVL